MAKIICTYNYKSQDGNDRRNCAYYESEFTDEELDKTYDLRSRLFDYEQTVRGKKGVEQIKYAKEGSIFYKQDVGYIYLENINRNFTDVMLYGEEEETAFIEAIISREKGISIDQEKAFGDAYRADYSRRFLNGVQYDDQEYIAPFIWAELSLQNISRYYGDNIPENIVSYFEELANQTGFHERKKFSWDSETKQFALREKLLAKQRRQRKKKEKEAQG
jgi:hypothetical protein